MKKKNKKSNIILIVIDALRAKNLSCYGYNKNTTPNLDKIAKKGALFLNAFSSINTSDPSRTSIMTGKLPITHSLLNHANRVTDRDITNLLRLNIRFLPEILKEEGYTTYGLDWLGRWHKKGFDYYKGDILKGRKLFEKVKKQIKRIAETIEGYPFLYRILRRIYREKIVEDAKELTEEAVDLISKKSKKPFFLFFHYWDTHPPYQIHKKLLSKFYSKKKPSKIEINDMLSKIGNINIRCYVENLVYKRKDINEIIALYDSNINFVDQNIGKLVKFIEKNPHLKNTVMIVTADHGESLTEHDIFFDSHGLYDESVKVPLIIHDFRKNIHKKINALVQHIDLFPTILEMLDIDLPQLIDLISLPRP